eukprot:TRINITY_DN6168_c0_g3_i8.p2 TRINITY_DN6168_c0_g3~~TRINITY_DN6168_c0_g3_i8.p2  ORF type:complete len:196 (+),score=0.14 TRINITY_DN6168_c0_g3_i8:78-665(+)
MCIRDSNKAAGGNQALLDHEAVEAFFKAHRLVIQSLRQAIDALKADLAFEKLSKYVDSCVIMVVAANDFVTKCSEVQHVQIRQHWEERQLDRDLQKEMERLKKDVNKDCLNKLKEAIEYYRTTLSLTFPPGTVCLLNTLEIVQSFTLPCIFLLLSIYLTSICQMFASCVTQLYPSTLGLQVFYKHYGRKGGHDFC